MTDADQAYLALSRARTLLVQALCDQWSATEIRSARLDHHRCFKAWEKATEGQKP